MRRGERASSISFRDVMLAFNAVLSAAILFVLPNINPPAKNNPDALPPPGSIAVLACWPEGAIDVDLWVTGPGQDKATGYPPGVKSGKVWALLRDDLGTFGDDGPANCESAFARVTPDGRYVINLHAYSVPADGVVVHVEASLNGKLLTSQNVQLRPKQERTVAQFRLAGGRVVEGSMNSVFQPLRSAGK